MWMSIQNLLDPLVTARVVCFGMLAVLFLQSGLDKVVDWKGNLSWLNGHFNSSPFRNIVPALLMIVTVFELGSGLTSFLGIGLYLFGGGLWMAQVGATLGCMSILMLFTGQRIAKEYAGAASLVPYFILSLLALLLTGNLLAGHI